MNTKRGFTLIEMLISVALFSVVMVVALGALLALSQSDRKAQSLKSVIDNLDFSLDSMSRTIRTGTNYYCGTGSGGPNCTNGDTYLSLKASDGSFVEYRFDKDTCNNKVGCIERQITPVGGVASGWLAITSPDLRISTTYSKFYVVGAVIGGGVQPRVTMILHGFIPTSGSPVIQSDCSISGNTCSVFDLQTSVTQRVYGK